MGPGGGPGALTWVGVSSEICAGTRSTATVRSSGWWSGWRRATRPFPPSTALLPSSSRDAGSATSPLETSTASPQVSPPLFGSCRTSGRHPLSSLCRFCRLPDFPVPLGLRGVVPVQRGPVRDLRPARFGLLRRVRLGPRGAGLQEFPQHQL